MLSNRPEQVSTVRGTLLLFFFFDVVLHWLNQGRNEEKGADVSKLARMLASGNSWREKTFAFVHFQSLRVFA